MRRPVNTWGVALALILGASASVAQVPPSRVPDPSLLGPAPGEGGGPAQG